VEAPARPHRRLVWKYTAIVVALVAAAIISVGLSELYFSSRDIKRQVTRIEQDKASSASLSVEQLVGGLLRELDAVAQPTVAKGTAGLEERNQDFHRLLDHEELISQLTFLDGSGREQVRTSPLEIDRIGLAIDRSRSPQFVLARRGHPHFGRVYFQRGSQPYMSISVAEGAPERGVVVATVDLSSVDQVIDRARVVSSGYAYAVDARGQLVTHPDINLVLRHTSFASLPQVRAALRSPSRAGA
jgi:two-component system NtrC family sensor kinase